MSRSTILIAVISSALAVPASAQFSPGGLMGGGDKPHLEPEGFYQVVLPAGFDCAERNSVLGKQKQRTGERVLDCSGTRGARASLQLKVLDVPRSATSALVALREVDRAKKQEHFKELERRKLQLGQLDGVMIRYRFNRLGHIAHPVQVVALFAVAKGKLFEIRFESREDQLPRYQQDLEQLFASFSPAQLDDAGNPILESDAATKKKIVKRPLTDQEFLDKQAARNEKRDQRITKKKKKRDARKESGW